MTNEELKAELQKPWQHGEHLDARGLVFDDPLVLDGMVLRGFDLSGAHFKAGFKARGATFRGLAWFRDTTIDGTLDLSGAQFRIDLRAEGLSVDLLRLNGVQVRGILDMARLCARRIDLSRALVLASLTLENAEVSEGIDLSMAEIMGGFWAKGARLGQMRNDGAEIFGRVHHSTN